MTYPYTYNQIMSRFHQDVEELKKKHVGMQSHLNYSLRSLRDLDPSERPKAAQDINRAQAAMAEFFESLPPLDD